MTLTNKFVFIVDNVLPLGGILNTVSFGIVLVVTNAVNVITLFVRDGVPTLLTSLMVAGIPGMG